MNKIGSLESQLMDAFKDFQEGKMGQLVDQPERV